MPTGTDPESWLRDGGQQLSAGLLAPAARFGAHGAVLHPVLTVLLTLVAARPAGPCACLQDRASDAGVVLRLPAQHAAGRLADVGAIEVRTDALAKVGDVLLAEAGVRTRGARLHAVSTGLDAARKRVGVEAEIVGVGAPTIVATPLPRVGSTRASVTPSATIPKTMVTPAMKPVVICRTGDMPRRRRPSAAARS